MPFANLHSALHGLTSTREGGSGMSWCAPDDRRPVVSAERASRDAMQAGIRRRSRGANMRMPRTPWLIDGATRGQSVR